MKTTVKAKGDLAKNLKAFKDRLAAKLVRGLNASAQVLLPEAKALCPVGTFPDTEPNDPTYKPGALRDSGQIRQSGSGLDVQVTVGFGWRDFDASPYGAARTRRPPFFYVLYVHQYQNDFLAEAVANKRQEMAEALNIELRRK